MSKTEKDQEFFNIADAFIDLANHHCSDIDKGKVSAGFLYAAARFNTYIVASSAKDVDEFESFQAKAAEYFVGEFRKMINEHMEDYKVNFDDYIKLNNANKTIN